MKKDFFLQAVADTSAPKFVPKSSGLAYGLPTPGVTRMSEIGMRFLLESRRHSGFQAQSTDAWFNLTRNGRLSARSSPYASSARTSSRWVPVGSLVGRDPTQM